jgi:hypothetical protein
LVHRFSMKQTDPQMKIRLPPDLKAKVEQAAASNSRSMGAEIVARLEASFDDNNVALSKEDVDRTLHALASAVLNMIGDIRSSMGQADASQQLVLEGLGSRSVLDESVEAYELALANRIDACKSINDLSQVWAECTFTIRTLGAKNPPFQHRVVGMFAMKKAELSGEEDLFSNLPEPTNAHRKSAEPKPAKK